LALTIGMALQCRLNILTTTSRTISVGTPVTTPVDITSWIRMGASFRFGHVAEMRGFVSNARAVRELFPGRHGPMIQVVLRLAMAAVHKPEAAIGIVITLKFRHQFVGSTSRTGELVELNT
jgi:hypothetical protein